MLQCSSEAATVCQGSLLVPPQSLCSYFTVHLKRLSAHEFLWSKVCLRNFILQCPPEKAVNPGRYTRYLPVFTFHARVFISSWRLLCGVFISSWCLLCGVFISSWCLLCGVFISSWCLLCGVFISSWCLLCGVFISSWCLLCGVFISSWRLLCGVFISSWCLLCYGFMFQLWSSHFLKHLSVKTSHLNLHFHISCLSVHLKRLSAKASCFQRSASHFILTSSPQAVSCLQRLHSSTVVFTFHT